ncbi:hypothetical protein GF319_09485 [Candidatus Bathyarchaeota archaeon]|nr:hypothetical protein [Candidatus Bathyarchaeota archaeon]
MGKRVLIIQNDPPETLGTYERYLRKKSELSLIKAYKMMVQDVFPSINDFDNFIIGPTPISANDADKHDFLRKEWEYLKKIIASGKPCLGVCCGAQMLAKIQGARILKSPTKEVGGYEVKLTPEGSRDPLFKGFPKKFPVFHWHSEMFTVPPEGKQLVEGHPCNIQAYAKNNVRGIIFHLEITTEDAVRWTKAYPDEPKHIGKSIKQVLEECKLRETEMKDLAIKLIENFLEM